MACAKFSPFLVAIIFGLLVAAEDDLRPLCSIASAQFVVGDTSLFTFEPRGKCTEAQLVFNDSSSLRIDIDGPDCTGLATHHVSLNATTPPGWAEFFLRCDDGGLCKNIFIQPKQIDGNSGTPNEILQECLGEVDLVMTTIELMSPGITQSLISSLNTQTTTAPEISTGTIQSLSINTYTVTRTNIIGIATTPDTYTMGSETAETTQAVTDNLTTYAATTPDVYTIGSQSTRKTPSVTNDFNTYTTSIPSTYLLGGQSTSISSYVDITSAANICSCCASI